MLNIIVFAVYFVSLYFLIFWLLVFLEKGAAARKIKLKKYPFVSICIPAYNEEANIAETLSSLLALNYPSKKYEIIVVNDGSTDKTAEIVKRISKKSKTKIRLLNQENAGKAAAINSGLKIARGEFFVVLDADSQPEKDALIKILPNFKKITAAVLPLIKVAEKKTLIQKIQHTEYIMNFFYKKLMGHLDCIHVTPGPFAVYRRNALKKVGGFDEKNLTEDLEIAIRLQKHNYKIKQLLDVEVKTKAPSTFASFYKQRNRWYKGALINVWNYKSMLLNKAYGDLGMFQLPMVIMSPILSITLFAIFFGIYLLKPIIKKIYSLALVNFDILPMTGRMIKNIPWLINAKPFLYGIIIVIAALIILFLSYKYTRQNIGGNLFSIIPYILIYPFIMSIIWLGIIFDFVRGKKQKW